MIKAQDQRSHNMKEQAYNIIKTKYSRTQRQSNLNKSKEARFKISPQEFEDHKLGNIVSLKYVYEHRSSESVGYLLKETSLRGTLLASKYYVKQGSSATNHGDTCMTKSLTKELFTPFKEPEQKFQASRMLLKTLSLDELRSPEFNLFSDLEEYSKEEVAKTIAKTMEQYKSKTRADYGSGIARPKIHDKDSFELKCKFLKEICDNTIYGSDHEVANEHIEKVLEIVDLFHIPNITQEQVMLRAFYMSLTRAASRWLRNKPSELLMKCPQHYLMEMQEIILFYNGLDVQTRQILDSKGAIPFKTAADAKVAIQEMANYSKKWHNGTFRTRSTETSDGLATIQAQLNNLGREIKKNKRFMFESRQTTIPFLSRLNDYYCEEKKGSYGPQFLEAYSYEASHIDKSIPRKYKDSGSFTLPCYINNVYVDNALANLGARIIRPFYGDYIELNDLNVTLELRRDQANDLMPTIKEGEIIDEPMIDIIKTRNNESFDQYPSFCDFDRKIHIDCAYNLRFSCMIVMENMDGYRDQDMGDIILGEPFCKASCVEAKRFDGLITIHNGSDNETTQIVIYFIESVFPDINMAYPLRTIRVGIKSLHEITAVDPQD
nr:hypothetical protein [Tanacetum cinerariifolium]